MSENIFSDEGDLILRVSRGDEFAFRQLFDHYRNRVYSLGMHLTRSELMAEELVQDVFLKVWTNRSQLTSILYFNAWLRTIAKNTCSNYLRSMAIEKLAIHKLGGLSGPTIASTGNELIAKELEKLIAEAIQRLPPQQKKVYLLNKQFSKKQEEIAQDLNISIYTVKEYMKLAQRSIRMHLGKEVELLALAAISIYF